ncbi:class I SAM-dependent methyltransferase [Saccharicrinis aurantiacus]|uniref:class I SAM-dependent methyltransferase n=1 Tax=Saccharicrinis aurantiacus TaxID=1849719 RepID=UPI0024937DCA|nr:class I SAM-dependent methyltransferase [Saccharicrinis aurantiacus]
MKQYLDGTKLYGNDFSIEDIEKWYFEENEAYANLGTKNRDSNSYSYHLINNLYGYNKIKQNQFKNVLGFGSAWGGEFEPIINNIESLTIIEPSEQMVSSSVKSITPKYIKPALDGKIAINNNQIDLITCFGTLHHIPNVSFVLSELIRVLKPNGYLLLREPIISMGDWNKERHGLTKNERGIPIDFFDDEFNKHPVKVLSKKHCFTMNAFLQRKIGRYFKKKLHCYLLYIHLDKVISQLLKNNVTYHATSKYERIAPSSIYYIIKKMSN